MIRFLPTILIAIFFASAIAGEPLAHADEPDDTSQFVTGVSSFHSGKYGAATIIVEEMLEKHPETPLRDLALALLSRSYFKLGKKDIAVSYAARLLKEYPPTPLVNQLEKELLAAAQNLLREKPATIASAIPSASTIKPVHPSVTKSPEQNISAKLKEDHERLAQLKAGEERIAKEKAEKERLTREQAEQERLAKLKADEERIAKEKAEKERLAREQAERERLAKLKADEERIAKEKVEQERLAREQAERERLTKLKADEERIAQEKVEQKRLTEENAKELAGLQRLALAGPLIPTTASLPTSGVPAESPDEAALHLEVRKEVVAPVGTEVPMTVVVSNAGKQVPTLSWRAPSSVSIRTMDPLRSAGGETASGTLGILVPVAIDGSRFHLAMKATTIDGKEAISNVTVIASAPLLRAVARGTKKLALPGEMVEFRIVVLNAGSLTAEEAELVVNLPQYVDIVTPGTLVVKSRDLLESSGLKIKPGEAREFPVRIRISSFAAKGQEIRISGTLISPQGEQKFSSPPVIVRLAD